jgi:hypothetical protein
MQVISEFDWPVVVLAAIGGAVLIVYWLREAIARALAERPMKFALTVGKVRAVAETRERDRIKEVRAALDAPASEQVLVADRLILRDRKGNARLLMSVMEDGSVLLGMFGENQKPGALLVVEANGKPGIEFYDGDTIRTQFRLRKGGNEALIFFDSNERMRSIIGLDAEGKSVVGLWDENGAEAWGSRA